MANENGMATRFRSRQDDAVFDEVGPPWTFEAGDGPVVATAIHSGHEVRPDVAAWLAIPEADRLREEDPLTSVWTYHVHELERMLVQDGMYFVGLDIVGDKLMEINVFSPGGIRVVERNTGVNFADVVIADLERKIRTRANYGPRLSNVQLATM